MSYNFKKYGYRYLCPQVLNIGAWIIKKDDIMKRYLLMALLGLPLGAMAQSPIDAYQLSQQDMKGTARFMSMGGAFGALGGDLSTLSQNPAGIGVYRSREVGLTLDLDCQRSTTDYMGLKHTMTNEKFYLNNIGFVWSWNLGNDVLENFNIGFTYNKGASYSRRYKGGVPQLKTSLSNYIAGIANSYNLTEADVSSDDNYDPYVDSNAPWSAILGYDSYLINPEGDPEQPNWQGQFGDGTRGRGHYYVRESGSRDDYNIALGGNFANKVYWGMNFDIVSASYTIRSEWGEQLDGAYVFNPNTRQVEQMSADWTMDNLYSMNATGFSYNLGVIVRPVQYLRFGLAFHTPTWFRVTENFAPDYVDYDYPFLDKPDYAVTNNDVETYNKVNLATPWKVIASVAGVIGNKAIISFDYEWNGVKNMKYRKDTRRYWNEWDDGWDDGWYDPWYPDWDYSTGATRSSANQAIRDANDLIKVIYKDTHTIRLGAEYRVLPVLSLRAGYSWTSSPMSTEARENVANVPTAGALANFRLDNQTTYVTGGIGFNKNGWYVDAAYVWKHMTSRYYPFAPDPDNVAATVMNPKVSFNNSQVVLSLGYKF